MRVPDGKLRPKQRPGCHTPSVSAVRSGGAPCPCWCETAWLVRCDRAGGTVPFLILCPVCRRFGRGRKRRIPVVRAACGGNRCRCIGCSADAFGARDEHTVVERHEGFSGTRRLGLSAESCEQGRRKRILACFCRGYDMKKGMYELSDNDLFIHLQKEATGGHLSAGFPVGDR